MVTMINVVMIDGLIFNSSHLRILNGLHLMTISQISMMSCHNFIVFVICCSCKKLMFGSSFKMVSS